MVDLFVTDIGLAVKETGRTSGPTERVFDSWTDSHPTAPT